MGIDHRVVADFRIFRHIGKRQDGHVLPHLGGGMDERVLADAFLHRFRGTEQLEQHRKGCPGIFHRQHCLLSLELRAPGNHDGPGPGLSGHFQIGRHRKGNLIILGFFQSIDSLEDHARISLKDFPFQQCCQFL